MKKLILVFEVCLMVVQFLVLIRMTTFFPNSIAEWAVNFGIYVYVVYEILSDYLAGRPEK